jgi:hypothetical protein
MGSLLGKWLEKNRSSEMKLSRRAERDATILMARSKFLGAYRSCDIEIEITLPLVTSVDDFSIQACSTWYIYWPWPFFPSQ